MVDVVKGGLGRSVRGLSSIDLTVRSLFLSESTKPRALASFNNKTISYFEFNNSLGIQGNINFSGPETVSLAANTPGMNLSFDEWDTIRMGLNIQQITDSPVQLTDSDTFKWHVAESETTVSLPTDSKVGTWIGFTNLSTTSNVVLANCTTISPATDQAGTSRRMVCISQGRWICS